IASLLRRQIVPAFHAFDLLGEPTVLDRVANPARIVVTPQVVEPRRLVDAGPDLAEHRKIVRLEVVCVVGPAEVKAVITKVAFRVFAMVSNALRTPGLRSHREGCLTVRHEPCHNAPWLM